MTEVFTKQVGTFREACLSLFGYRMDMVSQPSTTGASSTTFVLRPQHAEGKHAELIFKQHGEGAMELIPNEYTSKRLKTEVDTFVDR